MLKLHQEAERSFWKRKGFIRVAIIRNGKISEVVEFPNLIVNAGLNLQRDGLKGDVSDIEIKYLAWGGDSTAVAVTDTKLVSEFGRKPMTSKTAGGVGVLTSYCFINSYEGNSPQIEELGWFAGVTATAVKDSGVLIARVLYSHAKNALETIMVTRVDTIA